MKRKALAVVILFTSLFFSSAISLAFDTRPHSDCHQSEKNHDTQTDSESHPEKCHNHRTHCCSSSILIVKMIRPLDFFALDRAEFSETFKTIKPAPTLDGPFQPPRA